MIPEERTHLNIAARTHPGMSGKNNEDRYGVSAFRLSSQPALPSVLAVVADGIGGHRAGEVAAEMAVEAISRRVAGSDARDPVSLLKEAIIQAGQEIFDQAEKEFNQKGMGATCACAWVIGDRLYTASVGDSRIYLLHGGQIRQVSTDHTWIQEAIEQGALTPEEAEGHPNAHVIRRYLGSRQPVVPDVRLRLEEGESDEQALSNQGFRLLPGDQVLLCSDGLTDLVRDEEIAAIFKRKGLEAGLDELVSVANQRGGHDNITLVTLKFPSEETDPIPVSLPVAPTTARRPRRVAWGCLGLAGLFLVGGLLAGAVYLFLNQPGTGPSGTLASQTASGTTQLPGQLITRTPAPSSTPFPFVTNTPVITAGSTPAFTASPPGPSLTPWPTNTSLPVPPS